MSHIFAGNAARAAAQRAGEEARSAAEVDLNKRLRGQQGDPRLALAGRRQTLASGDQVALYSNQKLGGSGR